jgi:hypothetical protein
MKEQLIRLFEDSKAPGVCRGCEAPVEWYETVRSRRMPMNAGAVPRRSENHSGTGRVVAFFAASDAHWAICPQQELFKRRGPLR